MVEEKVEQQKPRSGHIMVENWRKTQALSGRYYGRNYGQTTKAT